MSIKKIKLANFKSFESVEIELGQMNILVGANASGKSNFLQALLFFQNLRDEGFENAVSLAGGKQYFKTIGKEGDVEFNIEEILPQTWRYTTIIDEEIDNFNPKGFYLSDQVQTYAIWIDVANKTNTKVEILNTKGFLSERFTHKNKPHSYLPSLDTSNFRKRNVQELNFMYASEQGKKVGTGCIEYPNQESITVTRLNGNNEIIILSELNPYEFLYSESDSSLFSFTETKTSLYDFDLKKAKRPSSIIGKSELESDGSNLALVLKRLLENEEDARRFGNMISDILPFAQAFQIDRFYDRSLLVQLKEKYNELNPIPSELLSDGTISVVAILVALFFEHSQLCMFEEPDRGLHPSLIAKVMEYFYEASKEKQIILTTHNPEILKYAKLEDIILVSRDENGYSTLSRPADKEMVKSFLENELGIDVLFTQNLLDA